MADVFFESNLQGDADFTQELSSLYFDLREIADGLEHYWRLEEASGTAFDVRGSAGDLDQGIKPGTAAGKVGNARDFDRASSHSLGTSDNDLVYWDGTQDFTAICWGRTDDLGAADQAFWGRFDNSANLDRGPLLFFDAFPSDRVRFVMSLTGTTNAINLEPTLGLSVNTFYFLEVTYNATTRLCKLRINRGTGASHEASATVPAGTWFKTTINFQIGDSTSGGNLHLDGRVDELLIYDRLLTDTELDAIYNNNNGLNLAPILFRYYEAPLTADADFTMRLSVNEALFESSFQADANFDAQLSVNEVLLEFGLEALADFETRLSVNETLFRFTFFGDAEFAMRLSVNEAFFESLFQADADFDTLLGLDLPIAASLQALAEFQTELLVPNVHALTDPLIGLEGQFGELADRILVSGISGNVTSPPQWQAETLIDLRPTTDYVLGEPEDVAPAAAPANVHHTCPLEVSILTDWFGKVFVLPQSIDLGLVITDQSVPMEIYSSFLDTTVSLDSFVNNVGAGTSLGGGFPSLPNAIPPQTGFTFTLEVSRLGPPEIDGTLDFTFDVPQTILVPVVGNRIRLFSVQPNRDAVERLQWRSSVVRRLDETEQRRSLRFTPRQEIDFTYGVAGLDRQFFENLVFEGQGRFFGLPVWWEPATLTAPVSPTDTVLNVGSTAFADLRVGGLVVVWQDVRTFEVFEVGGLTATTITVTSEADLLHPTAKTLVMPVRVASMSPRVGGSRMRRERADYRLRWSVVDNESDLSDTSAFPSFEGKPLLDEPNWISDTLRDGLTRRVTVIDGELGPFEVVAEAPVSRRIHPKTFLSTDRQRLWEIRRLLHALGGRRTSFWIPTFYDDLTPVDDIGSGDDTVDIELQGYTSLVQGRAPRDVLRLLLKDGTAVIRRVIDSSELSATEERVQVASAWGVNATLEEIDRIELLTKVRMNSDEAEIRHQDARGNARVSIPLIEVLE